jgi:hypothetical protein
MIASAPPPWALLPLITLPTIDSSVALSAYTAPPRQPAVLFIRLEFTMLTTAPEAAYTAPPWPATLLSYSRHPVSVRLPPTNTAAPFMLDAVVCKGELTTEAWPLSVQLVSSAVAPAAIITAPPSTHAWFAVKELSTATRCAPFDSAMAEPSAAILSTKEQLFR